jgi:hypothetical protein
MNWDIQITVSRLIAFVMIALGFVLSYILKDASAFITACTSAGVIIAIKTGLYAYGESKNNRGGSESSTTKTTTETETIKEN